MIRFWEFVLFALPWIFLLLVGLMMFMLLSPAHAGWYAQCAMKHEKAHCCGWERDHRGARLIPGCGRILMPSKVYKSCRKTTVEYRDVSTVMQLCLGNQVGCSHVTKRSCRIIFRRGL